MSASYHRICAGMLRRIFHNLRPSKTSKRQTRQYGICAECMRTISGRTAYQRSGAEIRKRISMLRQLAKPLSRIYISTRHMATVSDGMVNHLGCKVIGYGLTNMVVPETRGPMQEYEERVHSRVLRDDEHQRGMCLWATTWNSN